MAEMGNMEAMKRAYAEMILKTAKEAAERVMAAELRARRKEQELVSVKEEAATMLLRLKQMVDAKTKEAEITSMNQKKKFEVLESQLNEAEGIILDLREELNEGQERLNKLRKKQLYLKQQNEENPEERSLKTEVTCNGYELLTSSLNPGPVSDVYIADDRLRNGCTHKPCAVETSLVEEAFSAVEKLNESKTCNIENGNAVKSTSVLGVETQHGNGESVSIVRRSVRKRKLKFWDDVITVCGLQSSHQLKKYRQDSSDLSCSATHQMERCVKHDEDLQEGGPQIERLNDAEVSKELVHNEALQEKMELVDVLVKQDELAATFELTTASRIDCDVEDGTADEEASDLSYADDTKLCKYTFNRKCRKKSAIYPEKVLERGSQDSSLS